MGDLWLFLCIDGDGPKPPKQLRMSCGAHPINDGHFACLLTGLQALLAQLAVRASHDVPNRRIGPAWTIGGLRVGRDDVLAMSEIDFRPFHWLLLPENLL